MGPHQPRPAQPAGHDERARRRGTRARLPPGRRRGLLATASLDRTATVWNLADPGHPTRWATLAGHASVVLGVAFSPDGYQLATVSADRTAIMWKVGHPTDLGAGLIEHNHRGYLNAVAFSPDGRTMGTGDASSGVTVWDAADPAHPSPLAAFTVPVTELRGPSFIRLDVSGIQRLAFSQDEATLVVLDYSRAGSRNTVAVWDIADRARPQQLTNTIWGSSIALSRDGRTLLAANELWDLRDRTHPNSLGTVGEGTLGKASVSISPDAATAVTGGGAVLWDVTDPAHPAELARLTPAPTPEEPTWDSAFSPDGTILALAGATGTVALWDLTNRAAPVPLPALTGGHNGPVTAVAFAPNGTLLATTGFDRRVVLWDLTDRTRPVRLLTLAKHADRVTGAHSVPTRRHSSPPAATAT